MNPRYKALMNEIADKEATRIYCRHDMKHFLDVARIAHILNLEEALEIDKELIYATALLHDCGRHVEYESGTPHEIASGELSLPIMAECGFTDEETEQIRRGILFHRNREAAAREPLSDVIYRADKLSRACFACEAADSCHKAEEKRTIELKH